ncbi:MAG: FAD-binding oxidoreductase [Candidatus Eremiobacteraeota bacterium]|nr:FAD-binding oxidoreductase [Candidatus Eremiobacteraeota bacterium]
MPLPATTDVAIVGAGYTGLSAALALAKRGTSPLVLEQEDVGWGASARNGGMVLSGMKAGPRELIAKLGTEKAHLFDQAALAAIDLVECILAQEGIACSYSRCGHVALASKPAHFAAFERDAEVVRTHFNRDVIPIDKSALRGEVGSDAYFGGLLDEKSASVQPAQYVAGLAAAAQRAGATICAGAAVQKIVAASRSGARGFRLTTGRGDVFAREVVASTGAYTGSEFPALRKRVIPIGSYIIATERISDAVATEISPRNRMLFDSKHFLHYFRLTPDQRFLFGGRASFVPESEDTVRESADILRRDMLVSFPQLRSVATEHVWGGTIDFTFDMLPHIGRLEGIHYACGYAGHGVAMATYLGAQLARAIMGGPSDPAFASSALPAAPLGLYAGHPWFLPLAGVWFHILDALT